MLQHKMNHTNTKPIEAQRDAHELRLLVLRAGSKLFGVDMKAVAHTDDEICDFAAPSPTPLPGAPAPVRGVVHLRGKLYTVIDPWLILAIHEDSATPPNDAATNPSRVVPLRGREQLAIAIERIIKIVSINESNIESFGAAMLATRGIVCGIAEEDILVLDTGKLFAAATQGMERRRRRS